MRIAVLNNLRAGRSQPAVTALLSFLRDHPDVLHVETEGVWALPDALADLARQRVDLLVVNGGDGTLQHTLTEILAGDVFERLPMIAPLRGGRTNMTALDLGAQRSPVRGLERILDAARAGRIGERIVRRPVLRVASRAGRPVRYGMFLGAGMIHRAISLTHRLFPKGRSQGVIGSGIVTASLIVKTALRQTDGILTPDKVQILLDGKMVPAGEFYLVIASSLQRLFLRMNPFWGTGPGGVRFTGVASNAKHTHRAALGILRGRPKPWVAPDTGYTSCNARRVVLRLDCGYTIDGEVFDPRSGEVVTLTDDRRVTFVRA